MSQCGYIAIIAYTFMLFECVSYISPETQARVGPAAGSPSREEERKQEAQDQL